MNGAETGKGEKVGKDEVLILQGQEPRYMYYLHSGTLEILSAPEEFEGMHNDILLSKSKRVGIIQENTLVSGLSILFTEPYKKSIRAIEDSVVSKYPIKEGGFKQIAAENPSLTITILSHLYRRLEISIPDAGRYTKLYQNIARINDNLSLMFKSLGQGTAPEKLQQRTESLHASYVRSGGDFPTTFEIRFLVADNGSLLKKKYAFPGLPMEAIVDLKQCAFINRFIKMESSLLSSIIKKDPTIAIYMYEVLADNLMKVLNRVEAIHNEIDEEMALLFGPEGSWTSFLVDGGGFGAWQRSGRLAPDFLGNFLSMTVKIHSFFEEISGKKLSDAYPGFKKIHEHYMAQKSKASAEAPARARKIVPVGREYQNSIQQIFEFGVIDKEFQKNFLKVLNDFRKMQNPFNTEPDGRKIRRFITRMYLDLAKQVFLRARKESVIPPPVRLMLLFGFLDETMLEGEQLHELNGLSLKSAESTEIPIYFENEFLAKIYEGKENPSITEMGLSYEAHLKEEEKHKKSEKGGKGAAEDEGVNKAFYEIDHRLMNTIAVCSGSTATAFPILTSMVMRGNPANFYISKKKLESIVRSLMEVDFAVFYRETVVKVGEAREIIEEEVIPNFVLLPMFGTKTMLWQELDGTNRKTRGRIVVPTLFMGDLQRRLAHTFACFRWELNRSLKGAMWADPVEGGLTGIYFDYVNFFKKNSKLSVEAKERIAEKFKSIRTNRDRFADDYIQWVLYERDGIMKLNAVVREMFYRHVRFKKDHREKLENMPAYSEIATKFKNVHSRDITGYQRKFKKYADESGALPEALQKFMEYLEI